MKSETRDFSQTKTPYGTLIFRHFWNLALHSHCSHLPNVFRNSFTDCLETRFYYVSLFQITSAFFPSHDMYKVSPHATGERSGSCLQIHLHIGKFMHITFLTHIVFVGHIPFACSLCFENREFSGAVQLKLREIERGTFSAPWQLQRAADGRGTQRDAA